jgi:hypothetical protein
LYFVRSFPDAMPAASGAIEISCKSLFIFPSLHIIYSPDFSQKFKPLAYDA